MNPADALAHAASAGWTDSSRDYDPRDPEQATDLLRTADGLLEACPGLAALKELEQRLMSRDDVPLALHLAVKLARSKAIVRSVRRALHVSIVFAVYKERARMMRPEQHPHGEDCLVRKVKQLRWLFGESVPIDWSMTVVDDGCPEGSGQLAESILAERCPDAPARVLFLEDAIRRDDPVTRPMSSATDSQKGGAILLGMWTAVQEQPGRHIAVYTDADLSTHLGQTGLLIEEIVRRGMDAAIGSRRGPTSVVIKKGRRNTRGKLFIYLWKGLLSPLRQVTDTQCGFKAFSAATVNAVCSDVMEKKFAFDIELLLKTELRRRGSIGKVPIAWIDSEAASTTTDLEPYLQMLRAMVAMYRRYLPSEPDAERLAGFIERMTDAEWARLADNVPAEIADGDPRAFDRVRPVSVDDLLAVVER